ncbi:hypothetical protein L5G28_04675 [Gordonia sp. HY285]|uniref:hypothetical protein n=1 Tax=Gordonia liuliyuniae TaxID=2911517 RepID=UPI001F2CFC24|nr:hypothetical protein [Gordonia liuliyuniae]MCF8609455.1 hypothetical protein [Gordonia liuliyuniae]
MVVEDTHQRMVRLAEEFGSGGPQEAFDAGMVAARRTLADAERHLATLAAVDGLPALTEESVVEWWVDTATEDDRRAVIRSVVDTIVVNESAAPRGDRLVFNWRGFNWRGFS